MNTCQWNATSNRCGGFCRVRCDELSSCLFVIFTLATCPDGSPCSFDQQNRNGPCAPCGATPSPRSPTPRTPDRKRELGGGACVCAPQGGNSADDATASSSFMPQPADLTGDSNTTQIVAGAVVGGLLFILCILLIVWFALRRKREASDANTDTPQQTTTANSGLMSARSERPVSQYGFVPVNKNNNGSGGSGSEVDVRQYGTHEGLQEYSSIGPNSDGDQYELMPMDRT